MTIKFLDLYNQDKKIHSKYFKKLHTTFKKSDFIHGEAVKKFEREYARYCKSKYTVGCANGTDALYLSLKALNLPINSEVIVPAMTWISTILAIINCNLKPVLVDIGKETPLISIDKIKKYITKKTKVIMPVHLYGSVVDIKKIKQAIRNKSIYIIDDAAQAHGANDDNKKSIGFHTDMSCFSFYPGKNLGCYGDGGAIITNNKNFYNKLIKLRNLGSEIKHHHTELGINSRLDTVQAHLLSLKLKNLNYLNKKRVILAKIYSTKITNPSIEKLNYSKNCVFHQYVIKTKKKKKLVKLLKKNNIQFGFHYPKSINQLEVFKKMFKNKSYPNAENLAKYCISLPIDPNLKFKEINKIIKLINTI